MANLLVPVDFTLACHNAYRFALSLAGELQLDIVLAHLYNGSIDPSAPLHITGDGTIRGSYETRLQQFARPTAEGPDHPLTTIPDGVKVKMEVEGSLFAGPAILQRAEKEDVVGIVMATQSSSRILSKWVGSIATTVAEASERPVYLIPPSAQYRPLKTMVVANNREVADPYPLWQLEGLAALFNSKVYFTHVEKPVLNSPLRFKPWDFLDARSPNENPVRYEFDFVTVKNTNVPRGLLDFADEVEAELLVIINRTRSRWQALLNVTLTQGLALRSQLPVLVLHDSNGQTASFLNSSIITVSQS